MKRIAFTTLLNGQPYLEKQLASKTRDYFDEWYFIEGALDKTNDTACNTVPPTYYNDKFLSIDGTTEILDKAADDKIKVVRNNGKLWDGYVDMVNSIMDKCDDCLLMMIDVDEFWTPKQLETLLDFAEKNPYNTYFFMCYYFIGKDRYLFENNKYGNNHYEWNRLWKVQGKRTFKRLQPPHLYDPSEIILANKNLTVTNGWVFSHYAYALEEQVKFKSHFFNKGDVLLEQWKKIQEIPKTEKRMFSEFFYFEETGQTPIQFL
jgi:hypothetical protein